MDTRETKAALGMVDSIIHEVEKIQAECTSLDQCIHKIKQMLRYKSIALSMQCEYEGQEIAPEVQTHLDDIHKHPTDGVF